MKYETLLILNPVLSEEQMKYCVSEYIDFFFKKTAKLLFQEHWGLKKLAYSIQNKINGYYHVFYYKVNSKFLSKLELKIRRDERIIRFFSVKIDKDASLYIKRNKSNLVQADFF